MQPWTSSAPHVGRVSAGQAEFSAQQQMARRHSSSTGRPVDLLSLCGMTAVEPSEDDAPHQPRGLHRQLGTPLIRHDTAHTAFVPTPRHHDGSRSRRACTPGSEQQTRTTACENDSELHSQRNVTLHRSRCDQLPHSQHAVIPSRPSTVEQASGLTASRVTYTTHANTRGRRKTAEPNCYRDWASMESLVGRALEFGGTGLRSSGVLLTALQWRILVRLISVLLPLLLLARYCCDVSYSARLTL